jgi:hypothetical protein
VRVARGLAEGEKGGGDCGGLVLALTLGLELAFVLGTALDLGAALDWGAALDLGVALDFEGALVLVLEAAFGTVVATALEADLVGVSFTRLASTGICLACGLDASLRGRFCERVMVVSCGLRVSRSRSSRCFMSP